jgi:hypothetical protein
MTFILYYDEYYYSRYTSNTETVIDISIKCAIDLLY